MNQFEHLRHYLEHNDRSFNMGRRIPITKNLLNQVILPALYEIAQELEPHYHVKVSSSIDKAYLKVFEEFDFLFKLDARNDKKGYIELSATADAGIFSKKSAHKIYHEKMMLAEDYSLIENRIIEEFTKVFIRREELLDPFAIEEVREDYRNYNSTFGESAGSQI